MDEEDEDEGTQSRSSSRASHWSSRTTLLPDDDAEDDDDEVPKKAPKKLAASRPTLKPSANSGNGNSFLTAAEQRAQANKNDKKDKDSPFAFLQDPRDVRSTFPFLAAYTDTAIDY